MLKLGLDNVEFYKGPELEDRYTTAEAREALGIAPRWA